MHTGVTKKRISSEDECEFRFANAVALPGALPTTPNSQQFADMSPKNEELTPKAADKYEEIIVHLRDDVNLLHKVNDALAEKIEGLKMEKKADKLEIKMLKEKLNCLQYEKDALMDQIGELQKYIVMCQQENKELTNCLKLIGRGTRVTELELEENQWAKTYGDLCATSSAELQNMEEEIAELKVALEQMSQAGKESDQRNNSGKDRKE